MGFFSILMIRCVGPEREAKEKQWYSSTQYIHVAKLAEATNRQTQKRRHRAMPPLLPHLLFIPSLRARLSSEPAPLQTDPPPRHSRPPRRWARSRPCCWRSPPSSPSSPPDAESPPSCRPQ